MVLWLGSAVSHNCRPGSPPGRPRCFTTTDEHVCVCVCASGDYRASPFSLAPRTFGRLLRKSSAEPCAISSGVVDLISPLGALIGRRRHRRGLVPHVQEKITQNATKKPMMILEGGGERGAAAGLHVRGFFFIIMYVCMFKL